MFAIALLILNLISRIHWHICQPKELFHIVHLIHLPCTYIPSARHGVDFRSSYGSLCLADRVRGPTHHAQLQQPLRYHIHDSISTSLAAGSEPHKLLAIISSPTVVQSMSCINNSPRRIFVPQARQSCRQVRRSTPSSVMVCGAARSYSEHIPPDSPYYCIQPGYKLKHPIWFGSKSIRAPPFHPSYKLSAYLNFMTCLPSPPHR
jgi:hypothetical protein